MIQFITPATLASLARIEAMTSSLSAKFNPNHDEEGRFAEGGGGGDSSGGSGGEEGPVGNALIASYAGINTGTRSVKVEQNGQIKLSRPKSIDDAMSMIDSMDKIMTLAEKEKERDDRLPKDHPDKNPAVELRLLHVAKQFQRAMGYCRAMIPKATESELAAKLREMSQKWKLEPVDPNEIAEPELPKQ